MNNQDPRSYRTETTGGLAIAAAVLIAWHTVEPIGDDRLVFAAAAGLALAALAAWTQGGATAGRQRALSRQAADHHRQVIREAHRTQKALADVSARLQSIEGRLDAFDTAQGETDDEVTHLRRLILATEGETELRARARADFERIQEHLATKEFGERHLRPVSIDGSDR